MEVHTLGRVHIHHTSLGIPVPAVVVVAAVDRMDCRMALHTSEDTVAVSASSLPDHWHLRGGSAVQFVVGSSAVACSIPVSAFLHSVLLTDVSVGCGDGGPNVFLLMVVLFLVVISNVESAGAVWLQ